MMKYWGEGRKFVSAGDSKGRVMMQLHILKGSFATADTGAAGELEQCTMKAAVWSRMPEDLMWRVLQFVPAVKLFQWQLVSRQWRQVLTSHDFRKELVAMAAAARSGHGGGAAEQCPVIGYVTPTWRLPMEELKRGNVNGSSMNLKVVDIDLSFVPSWFWESDEYSVKAALDGLVLICNGIARLRNPRPPKRIQYCAINPLTRTYRMLPEVPFLPYAFLRSNSPVVLPGFHQHQGPDINLDWKMATYDLLEGAGGGQWTLIDDLVLRQLEPAGTEEVPSPDYLVVCDGEIFYCCEHELRFINSAGTAVTLDWPDYLDLDSLGSFCYTFDSDVMRLVAHGGSVFLVAELEELEEEQPDYLDPGPAMSCGIWRLVRSQLVWEAVAALEMEEVHRLIRPKQHADSRRHFLYGAWGAGDLLCVQFVLVYTEEERDYDKPEDPAHYLRITVGFSLKTGTWELLYDDDRRFRVFGKPLELRPDSFLL